MNGPAKFEILITPESGKQERIEVFNFKGEGGVGMGMYNTVDVSLIIVVKVLVIVSIRLFLVYSRFR